jgi:hypothetical protein
MMSDRRRGFLRIQPPRRLGEGGQVVIFDFSGLRQSTGEKTHDPGPLTKDANEFIDALDLRVVMARDENARRAGNPCHRPFNQHRADRRGAK